VIGFDKKMPWVKLRQPDSLLLNIKTTDIIMWSIIKLNCILNHVELSGITSSSSSNSGGEWTGDGKTQSCISEEGIFHPNTFRLKQSMNSLCNEL
jgi:hypothetical protein